MKHALRTILLALVLVPGFTLAQVFGYAVNSDDQTDADNLLRVNLETGAVQFIGPLPSALEDVEGLAFGLDGTLYAVDNATKSVFIVNEQTGSAVALDNRRPNLGFSPASSLDFGMTFTCGSQLLLVAEETMSLYEVDVTTGQARVIGDSGGLGAPMTAVASFASDTVALASGGGLYRIDVEQGTSELIDTISGYDISDAGLAFDASGNLWAILDGLTDSGDFRPSRVLRVDPATAQVTEVAQTRTGIESLAVAPPGGCDLAGTPMPSPAEVPVNNPIGLALLVTLLLLLAGRRLRPAG